MKGDAPSTASSVQSNVASPSMSSLASNRETHDVITPSRGSLGTAHLLRHGYGAFVPFMALLMLGAGYGTAQVVRAYANDYYDPGPLQPSANLARYPTKGKGDPCQFFDFVSKGWQKRAPGAANYSEALQQRVACAVVVSLVLKEGSAVGSPHQVPRLFQRCAQLAFNQRDGHVDLHRFLGRFNLSCPASYSRSKLETPDVLVALDWGVPLLSQLTVDTRFKRPEFRTLHSTCDPCTFQWFLMRNVLQEEGPVLAYFELVSVILNGSAAPNRPVEEVVNRHLRVVFGRGGKLFVLNKRLLRFVAIPAGNVEDTTGHLAYVTWHVVLHLAPMTSHPLPREQFLDGRDTDKRPRGYMTGRCYRDAALPLAFAQVFNDHWLAASSVGNATAILGHIWSGASATIAPLPWTDGEMRYGALEKLATLRAVVDRFDQGSRNEGVLQQLYPHVTELNSSYLDMWQPLHATELNVSKRLHRVRGPTSQKVGFLLTGVNASYIPVYQVIVIPAGNLYPPCYVASYSSSSNMASLGQVVGHEITHAFHADEAKFSWEGLHRDWWTPAPSKKFSRQLACLRRLYNETPWTGAVGYGAHAVSKNFAVSGGLLKAYREYRVSGALQHSGASQQGTTFTGEESFASSCFKWCSNDDQGPVWYSLGGERCNRPLMNMSEFVEAFDCALASAMNQTSWCGAVICVLSPNTAASNFCSQVIGLHSFVAWLCVLLALFWYFKAFPTLPQNRNCAVTGSCA
ncbi:endothelin-converting enzyme 1-like [Haemaphysalis longicornis]